MMSCLIRFPVCFYLLSLAVSLETHLHSKKSSTPLFNSKPVTETLPKENVTEIIQKRGHDFSTPLPENSNQTEILPQKNLKKMKNIGLERSKNRTRKQKKGVANATLPHIIQTTKEHFKTQSKINNTKDIRHQNKMNNSRHHAIKSDMLRNTSRHKNIRHHIKPNHDQTTSVQMTKMPRETLSPTTSMETRTQTVTRKDAKSPKVAIKTPDFDARSKNRPQRNRHRKPQIPRRHRYRFRFWSGNEEKILSNGKRTSKETKKPPTGAVNVSESKIRDASSLDKNSTVLEKEKETFLSEEAVRELKLKMFIKNMADKLRMTPEELMTRPNRRTAPKIPKYLLEETLQDNAMQRSSDQFFAKDQQVIIAGHDLGRNCIAKRTSGCYSFDLASNINGDVASAQLWLYKTPDRNDTSVQTFILYGLERLKSGRVLAQNQIQRHDSYVREGWVVINITRTVTSWVEERKEMEMIAIRCSTCVTRNHKALFGSKHAFKPLIIIKYDKTSLQPRHRRSYDDCDPELSCCKRRLKVNFRDIGMYSIEAPTELSVGYCYGKCNSPHVYTHNHTMIKQRIRFVSDNTPQEIRENLTPCCVPISFMPAMLLIRTAASGAVTSMPNVIVHQCGCV